MDANELRALADALDDCDPPYYESSPQINRSLDACIAKAADYLRAQADAQPVAWIAHNLTTGHVKWTTDRCRARGWTRSVNLRVKPLYAHPAPAVPTGDYSANGEPLYTPPVAPQDEPIDPHMIVAEDRFPDAQVEPKPTPASGDDLNVYREMADSYRNDAQAEPKRSQPLLDLLAVIHCDGGDHTEAVGIERSIKNAQDAVCALKVRLALAEPKRDWTAVDAAIREYLDDYELIGEDDAGADACYTPTERELYLIYDAITGLLADESFVAAISAPRAEPKREPLSDERIDTALQTDPVLITRLMIGSMTVGEFRAALRRLARIVERALEIGDSDAE